MEEDLAKMKENLEYYEKQKKKRNQNCYNYRNKHLDEMREKAKIYAKKYYDARRTDPIYLEKKRISALKSIHKKKQQEKAEHEEKIECSVA